VRPLRVSKTYTAHHTRNQLYNLDAEVHKTTAKKTSDQKQTFNLYIIIIIH
jgi:hypothetical protein